MRPLKLCALLLGLAVTIGIMAGCNTEQAEKKPEKGTQTENSTPEADAEGLRVSDFLEFESGATTKEQVVAAIGPCHETCRTAFVHEIYHTSDGETISVCYSADGTVDLIAKCSWDGNSYHNTEMLVTRKIYVSDFLAFQAGVTTREQVTGKVGSCQEHYGSGFIEELYYTYDGAIISVYFSPDQTVGYVMELARDGKYYTIKNRLVE